MQTINRIKAKELIKDSKGLIFSTTYIKKDNTIRTLTSRTGKQYTPTGKKQVRRRACLGDTSRSLFSHIKYFGI